MEAVTDITRHREISKLKKIVDTNQVLAKHIDHYSSFLYSLENNIEALAQRKPEAKSELQYIIKELAKIHERLAFEKEREVTLHG